MKLQKNIIVAIALLLFSQALWSQENEPDTLVVHREKYERFYIETGIHIPLDNLSKIIKPSPQFGFWYRHQYQDKNFIEIGFNFFIPIKNESFIFNVPDTLIKTNALGVSGMFGFRFNKIHPISQKKDTYLEWNTSVGYAFFMYDANYHRSLQINNDDSEKPQLFVRAFSTFHLGSGLKINFKNMGFQVHYLWTPYALFSDYIDNNFGAQALQVGLFYRQ